MNLQAKANLSANAFRLHYDGSCAPSTAFNRPAACSAKAVPSAAPTARHWLLDSTSGRDLLKMRLKQEMPDVKTSFLDDDAHLDADLERMVDVMGLRNWAAPVGMFAKVRAVFTVAKFESQLILGYEAPSFSDLFSTSRRA